MRKSHFPLIAIPLLLLLLSSRDASGQLATFRQVNAPSQNGQNLFVHFTDSLQGVVVTMTSVTTIEVFSTTDAGTTWTKSASPKQDEFHSLSFPSGSIGYAVGGHAVDKTLDGGQSWQRLISPADLVTGVAFVNDSVGYICGRRLSKGGFIQKTTDGGTTWKDLFPTSTEGFSAIGLYKDEIVSVLGDSNIWASYNSGGSWNKERPYVPNIGNRYSMNVQKGFLYILDPFIRSAFSDYPIHFSLNGVTIHDIGYASDAVHVAVGTGGNAFLSSNTFDSVRTISLPTSESLHSIHFPQRGFGYIAGDNGTLLSIRLDSLGGVKPDTIVNPPADQEKVIVTDPVTDIGTFDWKRIPMPTRMNLKQVHFSHPDSGIVTAQLHKKSFSVIFRTQNGGISWDTVMPVPQFTYEKMKFVTPLIGYMIDSNVLLQSTDGGQHWKPLWSTFRTLRDFDMTRSKFGVMTANNSWVGVTTDGGSTWNEASVPHDEFFGVGIYDNNNIALSAAGSLFQYNGLVAQPAFIDGWQHYSRTRFESDLNIAALYTLTPGIRNSFNGFSLLYMPADSIVNAVGFAGVHAHYAVGLAGKVYATPLRFTVTTVQQTSTKTELNDVYFLDSLHGYIVGDSGVLYLHNALATMGTSSVPSMQVNSRFSVTAFPNPSSSSLGASQRSIDLYCEGVTGPCELTVINMLGEIVQRNLISPSSPSASIEISVPGVYEAILRSESRCTSEIRTMVRETAAGLQ